MPITFSIEQDAVFSTATGVVSLAEVIEHLKAKVDAGVSGRPELFDARGITSVLSTAEVRDLAREAARALGEIQPGRLAVVTNNPLHEGLTHSYAIFTGHMDADLEVFGDFDKARDWLLKP